MRKPKGYVGDKHETIGSDLLAVLGSLEALTSERRGVLPEKILGAEVYARLRAVEADGWYPIAWFLEMMEILDRKLGRFALLKMGRTLFKLSHEARVVGTAHSGWDIVQGIDVMYRHANRGGGIGGWRVCHFGAEAAELEKTTPHHCVMEEGLLAQAFSAVGTRAIVTQRECFRDGADACRYLILANGSLASWVGHDQRWLLAGNDD